MTDTEVELDGDDPERARGSPRGPARAELGSGTGARCPSSPIARRARRARRRGGGDGAPRARQGAGRRWSCPRCARADRRRRRPVARARVSPAACGACPILGTARAARRSPTSRPGACACTGWCVIPCGSRGSPRCSRCTSGIAGRPGAKGSPAVNRETPLRPDASAALRRAEPRRWLPTIAVLAVVLATTLGGFVVSAASSESTGPTVSIDGVVSVRPLSGWEPAEVGSLGRPSDGGTHAWQRHTRCALAGDLSSVAPKAWRSRSARTLPGSLDQLRSPSSSRRSCSTRGSADIGSRSSASIVRSGAALEGEVTTVVSPGGHGVVFVGLAPEGLLAFVDGDLHTMIATAVVGSGG